MNVVSSAAEGDFMTYVATIAVVLKNTDTGERKQKDVTVKQHCRH